MLAMDFIVMVFGQILQRNPNFGLRIGMDGIMILYDLILCTSSCSISIIFITFGAYVCKTHTRTYMGIKQNLCLTMLLLENP